jgi:uncharacterized Ntn-hydrolase superfamily protein
VTFAIVACDRGAGEVGVAVASKVLAVGAFCPYVRGGVGAVSSQAYLNPYLGYDCVRLMTEGVAVGEAVDRLLAGDPGRDWRQLIAVDAAGQPRAYTGARVDPWCGDRVGDGFAVAGNILYGPLTLDAMAETFAAQADLPLAERLLASLAAGDSAGGDRRGRQSAALLVGRRLELPYASLRVDDHPDPIVELIRLYDLARDRALPLGARVSTTREPQGPQELAERQHVVRQALGIPD